MIVDITLVNTTTTTTINTNLQPLRCPHYKHQPDPDLYSAVHTCQPFILVLGCVSLLVSLQAFTHLPPHETAPARGMKVKIKKWAGVATWRWDIPEDDVCGICQIHFDGSCPSCRFPGDDCELCQPACLHCISRRTAC